VYEFAGYELVEMLDGSGIPYVLIDPPPVDDEPIPQGLRIEPPPVFDEWLGRRGCWVRLKRTGRKSTEASEARPPSSPPYVG
jgi:hypothetical protein